mgnify:CR=1 FL=1|jgi:hypothetical protein
MWSCTMLPIGGHYNLPEYADAGTKISKQYRRKYSQRIHDIYPYAPLHSGAF